MRKALMALAAVSLAVPVSMAVPTDGAQARKHYRYKEWRGRDGRTYCRKSDGTTGLIIGGIAGGALGNVIAPGDSKTLGTVLGAIGGAVAGRAIDKGGDDDVRCR